MSVSIGTRRDDPRGRPTRDASGSDGKGQSRRWKDRTSPSSTVVSRDAGLYVHFPWCVRKCPYCDFNSHPLRGSLRETEYLDALLADLEREHRRFGHRRVTTVYFGGGTPSLFSPSTFRALLRDLPDAGEVTLEANPGTIEHGDFNGYRRAGITRVSLGAQSFDPARLNVLGRIHGTEDIGLAAADAKAAGIANLNIDLMYALPRQTVAQALDDLAKAIRLEPEHISWYELTIEPKTEFARRPPAGLPDIDRCGEIEEAGIELLASHGYQRYEVSAFARDGHVCAHNVNYWRFGDYMGIGAGAHGKLTNGAGNVVRTAKASQPRLYLDGANDRNATVTRDDLPGEFMMNALRLVDGVERELFEVRTALGFDVVEPTVAEMVDWGLMHPDRLALTPQGFRQLNGVVARFLP
ncbi:MAG: radical SAM family heme chaperone HemW [Gammaproteobacteria bacterium]|nr:radical SAM family heme chaperone HemW [Gammaproteobacteria bacterium]